MVGERFNTNSEDRPAIRVGVRVHVAYVGPTREPTFASTVRQVGDDFIRLDLYALPTRRLPPQPGEPVVLIAQQGDQLRAFDAHVIGIESAPAVLVLTPPVEARRSERRRFQRVTAGFFVDSAAWLDLPTGARPMGATELVDISVGGMRLRASTVPPKGAELYVQMRLNPNEVIEIAGQVVGVRAVPDSDLLHVNVEFTQVDPSTYSSIVSYVDSALSDEHRTAA